MEIETLEDVCKIHDKDSPRAIWRTEFNHVEDAVSFYDAKLAKMLDVMPRYVDMVQKVMPTVCESKDRYRVRVIDDIDQLSTVDGGYHGIAQGLVMVLREQERIIPEGVYSDIAALFRTVAFREVSARPKSEQAIYNEFWNDFTGPVKGEIRKRNHRVTGGGLFNIYNASIIFSCTIVSTLLEPLVKDGTIPLTLDLLAICGTALVASEFTRALQKRDCERRYEAISREALAANRADYVDRLMLIRGHA